MKLVIVESPSKAKTIQKYLGKDYHVVASKGHIIDLPKSEIGIDIENDFEPKYVVSKEATLRSLKEAYKQADELILAVDPDREGEAIGWHIALRLKAIKENGSIVNRGKPVKRIVFTEITKDAIGKSIKDSRTVDINLVNAQQARRILDRIVGYKLSPLLWKKIRFGLSAGRVQSVALKLIVDREREREAFKAEEYWSLEALLTEKKSAKQIKVVISEKQDESHEFSKGLVFEYAGYANDKSQLANRDSATKVIDKVKNANWIIDSIVSKKQKRSPKPPFTTSTLQQACANKYGMSAKQTMSIAQKLYEAGYITYMRTDSVNVSAEAVKKTQAFIAKNYGNDYLPKYARTYKTKSKVAQEAHEAIRPSDITKTANKLALDSSSDKVYTLIRNRMLASQMEDAVIESTQVKVRVSEYFFKLNGQKILFPGFLSVYPESTSEQLLPKLTESQELFLNELFAEQHFTSPPARYSEASLIKSLEQYGIGRPSTYAPTISTILARKYVEKEGRNLIPTDTGMVVTRLLEKHFPNIVDISFTANLEEDLDHIAEGKRVWTEMMHDFYQPFAKQLEVKDKEISRDDFTVLGKSNYKCPDCKGPMIIKLGRYGRFVSCSNFPECKGMRSEDGKTEADQAKEAYTNEFLSLYKPAPQTEDGKDYLLKRGRYGKFWAHPGYPKIKDAKPLEFTSAVFKKVYGTKPKSKDGKRMVLRNGKFGEFWAHPNYPEVKEVIRLNKKEIEAKKQALGII